MSYQQVAYEVMKLFLTDFTEEELKNCINRAYDSKFDTTEIAPLKFADGAFAWSADGRADRGAEVCSPVHGRISEQKLRSYTKTAKCWKVIIWICPTSMPPALWII